jgi:EAL domain-containing protein (putative c-di-GMP-specific phosphodiesterase class I)
VGVFRSALNVADLSLEIETAVGIAVYPDHGDDSTTLLQRADIAMRMARHDGLGIMVYDSEIDPLSLKRLQLHGELREAIENGGMTLYYQPKVDIKTGRIVGVEALARWPHPREGMIPPNDFIPMIEQSGLIQPFTYWALEEAIKVLRRWKDDGIELVVSVNLSARNLLDSELPGSIAALLYAYQVSANNLCLEITESAIMSQPERALTILNQLHETGATISIDDFGTGYSSLSYLKKLPVDELKIDQSFIFGLTRDSDDETIVHSTIELAHNLSLKTVGEGVENKGILNMLGVLNCDIAQGYHISRPLPLEELQEFLRDSPWGLNS